MDELEVPHLRYKLDRRLVLAIKHAGLPDIASQRAEHMAEGGGWSAIRTDNVSLFSVIYWNFCFFYGIESSKLNNLAYLAIDKHWLMLHYILKTKIKVRTIVLHLQRK